MDQSEIYSPLPKEICDISHLINLEPGTSKKPEDLILEWLPEKDSIEDFKYKVYTLKETIEKNKPSKGKCKSGKCLNSKQRRALFNLKKAQLNFQKFDEINQLWHSYFDSIITEETKNKTTQSDLLKLARIDLHGAFLLVCSSKNVSLIGIKGYVIQESRNIFRILNQENRQLSVPKYGSIFAFEHKDKLYKINGNNIMMSSINRSRVKAKFMEKFMKNS